MHNNRKAPDWWKSTTVYQIYPRSFYDSNGDGIGDLPGILEKLDYLVDLGIETLWLCPFWGSPQKDFGYDISDHHSVAPEYGTLDDCRRLLDAAHARGLRVVLDMVLNHTSSEHPWFQESRRSRKSPRRDFYIWRKGRRAGGGAPPNNWRSLIGPRGWHYDAPTDEWYFASFLPFQPDLNYRNPAVKEAMLEIVRHWLKQGFDGLRLDIFNCLYKDPLFRDNPFSLRPLPSEGEPDGFFQAFRHSVNHPDTFAFARTLRRVIDELPGPQRFLVGEVFGPPEVLRKYCAGPNDADAGLHLVFLFKSLNTPFSATAFRDLIAEFEHYFPAPLLPTYVFGNHDRPRRGERLAHDRGREKLMAALQLTVRGVPFVYYGEEIGMHNLDLKLATALDPVAHRYHFIPERLARFLRRRGLPINRDECRSPMQWTSAAHAGFMPEGATAQPWLPVHPLFEHINVAEQQGNRESLFHCYKRLLALRAAHPALHSGTLTLGSAMPARDGRSAQILSYLRTCEGESLEILLNFSADSQTASLSSCRRELLFSTYLDGRSPSGQHYVLRPHEAVVLKPLAGESGISS